MTWSRSIIEAQINASPSSVHTACAKFIIFCQGEGGGPETDRGAAGGEPDAVLGSEEKHGRVPTAWLGAGAALQDHQKLSG